MHWNMLLFEIKDIKGKGWPRIPLYFCRCEERDD